MRSECILDQNQDPRFPQDSWLKSWIDTVIKDVPKSKIFHKTSVQILDLGSWFWEGMHSLAFSGSDKIALLSTFWSSICHLVRLSKRHSEELSLTISPCERERLKKTNLVLFLRAHGDAHFGHSAVDQRAGAGH